MARQSPGPHGPGLDERKKAGLLTSGSSYSLRLTARPRAVASWSFRRPLQRRYRTGFTPVSLFSPVWFRGTFLRVGHARKRLAAFKELEAWIEARGTRVKRHRRCQDAVSMELVIRLCISQIAVMRIPSLLILAFLVGTLCRADTPEPDGQPIINMCGIGAVVTMKDGKPTIQEVLPNDPAAHAGLMEADQIVQIDNREVAGLDLIHVVTLIRGAEGTMIKIDVVRAGSSAPISFSMRREPVVLPPTPTHH
jgi:hypothetical protein